MPTSSFKAKKHAANNQVSKMGIEVRQTPSTIDGSMEINRTTQSISSLTEQLLEDGQSCDKKAMAESFSTITSKLNYNVSTTNGSTVIPTLPPTPEPKTSHVDLCKLLDTLTSGQNMPTISTENLNLRTLVAGVGGLSSTPSSSKPEVPVPAVSNGQLLQLLRSSFTTPADNLTIGSGCQLLNIPPSNPTLPIAAATPQNYLYLLLQSAILRQMQQQQIAILGGTLDAQASAENFSTAATTTVCGLPLTTTQPTLPPSTSSDAALDTLMLTSRLQQTIAALTAPAAGVPPIALLSLDPTPSTPLVTISPTPTSKLPPPNASHLMAALDLFGFGNGANTTNVVTTTTTSTPPNAVVNANELLNQLYKVRQEKPQSNDSSLPNKSTPSSVTENKVSVPTQSTSPSNSSTTPVRGARNSDGALEPCLVCGDIASGRHYGVISCEGCKGFFKRSIRGHVNYVCRSNKQCVVNKAFRNRCQYCRMQKCRMAGMRSEAVQNERRLSNAVGSPLSVGGAAITAGQFSLLNLDSDQPPLLTNSHNDDSGNGGDGGNEASGRGSGGEPPSVPNSLSASSSPLLTIAPSSPETAQTEEGEVEPATPQVPLLPKPLASALVTPPPPNVTLASTSQQHQINLNEIAALLAVQPKANPGTPLAPIPVSRNSSNINTLYGALLASTMTSLASRISDTPSLQSSLQVPLPPLPHVNRSTNLLTLLRMNADSGQPESLTKAAVAATPCYSQTDNKGTEGVASSGMLAECELTTQPSTISHLDSNASQVSVQVHQRAQPSPSSSNESSCYSRPAGRNLRKRRGSSCTSNIPSRKRSTNSAIPNPISGMVNLPNPATVSTNSPTLNEIAFRVLLVTADWLRRCGPLEQLPPQVQNGLISFSWVDLFLLGLCQMYGRRLNALWVELGEIHQAADGAENSNNNHPLNPYLNSVVSTFMRANVSAEEYTYLRYMVLFNPGGIESTDCSVLARAFDIEQRIQSEFAAFLSIPGASQQTAMKIDETAESRATSRGLQLMSLVCGLRRITTDDIGRAFFPGISGKASIKKVIEELLEVYRKKGLAAPDLQDATTPLLYTQESATEDSVTSISDVASTQVLYEGTPRIKTEVSASVMEDGAVRREGLSLVIEGPAQFSPLLKLSPHR